LLPFAGPLPVPHYRHEPVGYPSPITQPAGQPHLIKKQSPCQLACKYNCLIINMLRRQTPIIMRQSGASEQKLVASVCHNGAAPASLASEGAMAKIIERAPEPIAGSS